MNSFTKPLSIAAALLLSSSAVALAAQDAPAWFQQMDDDGNGLITREEASTAGAAAFAAADADSDQAITPEEWGTYHKTLVGLDPNQPFEGMSTADYEAAYAEGPDGLTRLVEPDRNQDDRIDVDEFDRAAVASFDRLDRDHDRMLNAEEWDALYEEAFVEGDVDSDAQVTPLEATNISIYVQDGEAGRQQASAETEADADEQAAAGFGMLDADADGYVTLDEILAYNADKFERQDTDGNGVLTAAEWDLRSQEHFGYRVNPEELDYQTESTFREHDANGNNAVTMDEWNERIRAEFAAVDGNNDGLINIDELAYHYIEIVPDND